MNSHKISPATESNVPSIVHIHLSSFQGFFLTFLGARFLRVLYSSVLKMETNISLVAHDEQQKVLGFVVGVVSPQRLYKRLLADHWLQFALASVGPALRRPTCIPRLFRALKSPSNKSQVSADCLLMSIAVNPEAASKGIGRRLISEFLTSANERKVRSVCLTTDSDNNERTNQFYLNTGFNLHRTFTTQEGRNMNEYVLKLRPKL